MRILITGATGFIGGRLARRLAAEAHQIIAVGRSPARLARHFPGAWTVAVDFAQAVRPDDWAPHLAGVDAVVNAAGVIREGRDGTFETVHHRAPAALFDACLAAGVRRVIQISALGADTGETRYHRTKRAADVHLAGLDPSGARLDWCVLRPSIVYGTGSPSTALFAALAAQPVLARVAGPPRIQPIHADDLAEVVARLLDRPAPLPRVLEAVGPEPLPLEAFLRSFRDWLGLRPAPAVTVPVPALRLIGLLGERLDDGPVNRESIAMLLRGNVGDPGPMTAATGVSPVAVPVGLAREPATAAARWQARLWFLRAPLRLSLAFLWIASGLVSLGLYPVTGSYALLAEVGVAGLAAPLLLYGAAAWDLLLGVALLVRWRPRLVGGLQLATIAVFTAILTVGWPAVWLHPFGPVVKNVPVAVATLVMMALEE